MTSKKQKTFPRADDPLNCQMTSQLGYEEFFKDCDRREARGEKPAFCTLCRRFRWQDKFCDKAVITTAREIMMEPAETQPTAAHQVLMPNPDEI